MFTEIFKLVAAFLTTLTCNDNVDANYTTNNGSVKRITFINQRLVLYKEKFKYVGP